MHVTMLNEPGCEYVGHKAMPGHTAVDLFNGIVNCIPPEEFKSVLAIGADGTDVNAGQRGGAISLITKTVEEKMPLEC